MSRVKVTQHFGKGTSYQQYQYGDGSVMIWGCLRTWKARYVPKFLHTAVNTHCLCLKSLIAVVAAKVAEPVIRFRWPSPFHTGSCRLLTNVQKRNRNSGRRQTLFHTTVKKTGERHRDWTAKSVKKQATYKETLFKALR